MKPPVTALSVLLIVGATLCPSVRGGGFDRAAATLMPRAVKLYGIGAGLQAGFGTGFLVSQDGLVLTVFSLLIDARRIRAVVADGTAYDAEIVYTDPVRHLTLLKLEPPHDEDAGDEASAADRPVGPLPFFDLREGATLTAGDWVLTAGNAFKVADGAEPMSLAHGVFSTHTRLDARRRLKDFSYMGDVLVIDAITSNPGAPGGAVVNLEGRLVGMIGRVVTSNLTHTHFNYAVPRDVLLTFFEEALTASARGDRVASTTPQEDREDSPDLGIRVSSIGYRTTLPFVDRVLLGSPAQRAGVRKDDLILSVNGRTVKDVAGYRTRMTRRSLDEPVSLVLRRGRRIVSVHIEPEGP